MFLVHLEIDKMCYLDTITSTGLDKVATAEDLKDVL